MIKSIITSNPDSNFNCGTEKYIYVFCHRARSIIYINAIERISIFSTIFWTNQLLNPLRINSKIWILILRGKSACCRIKNMCIWWTITSRFIQSCCAWFHAIYKHTNIDWLTTYNFISSSWGLHSYRKLCPNIQTHIRSGWYRSCLRSYSLSIGAFKNIISSFIGSNLFHSYRLFGSAPSATRCFARICIRCHPYQCSALSEIHLRTRRTSCHTEEYRGSSRMDNFYLRRTSNNTISL